MAWKHPVAGRSRCPFPFGVEQARSSFHWQTVCSDHTHNLSDLSQIFKKDSQPGYHAKVSLESPPKKIPQVSCLENVQLPTLGLQEKQKSPRKNSSRDFPGGQVVKTLCLQR